MKINNNINTNNNNNNNKNMNTNNLSYINTNILTSKDVLIYENSYCILYKQFF